MTALLRLAITMFFLSFPLTAGAQEQKYEYGKPTSERKWSFSVQIGSITDSAGKSTAVIALGPHRTIIGGTDFRINLGVAWCVFSHDQRQTRTGWLVTVPITYANFTVTYGRGVAGLAKQSNVFTIGVSVNPF